VARRRFDTVRNFSRFIQADDPVYEVPPAGVFGRGKRPRPTPTIIEPEQVRAIMTAALDVASQDTISPYTYHYLFGLLAATGLRISEALALQCNDLVEDGLIVRNGKFGKQRLITLQPSTRQALEAYLATRARLGATGNDLFVTIRGRAPHKVRAHVVFVRLARQLGYRGPTGTAGMRLHDLRHTFAVRSLESCPRDREAIAHHMAGLRPNDCLSHEGFDLRCFTCGGSATEMIDGKEIEVHRAGRAQGDDRGGRGGGRTRRRGSLSWHDPE